MIVVVGLAFEARIAAGPGVEVICSGDGQDLAASLARAVKGGCGGLISFGVAGGLAPDLKPGTCVIGSTILHDAVERPTDARWAQRLMRIDRKSTRLNSSHLGISYAVFCLKKKKKKKNTNTI